MSIHLVADGQGRMGEKVMGSFPGSAKKIQGRSFPPFPFGALYVTYRLKDATFALQGFT